MQKFDKLGKLIIESNSSASEIIKTDEFNQVINSIDQLDKQSKDKKQATICEDLVDKYKTLVCGDDELGIYVMPGMTELAFDYDTPALEEFDDSADPIEDYEDIDMECFFGEIGNHEKIQADGRIPIMKQRAPSIVGDEQKKLYKELQEINTMAPERNDLAHMEHLYQLWIEREQEEI